MSSNNKFLNRMFRKIGGVVLDILSGSVGVKTEQGIFTFAVDEEGNAGLTVNPLDLGSFSLPAFAFQKPVADIRVGDLVVGDNSILGWAIQDSRPDSVSLKLLDTNGNTKTYVPPKVAIMNSTGVLVVQNLFSTGVPTANGTAAPTNTMATMLPLLLMGDGDIDPTTLLLLSGGLGGNAGAGAPAAMNPMMLLALTGGLGDKSGSGKKKMDPLTLMALSGGLGGGAGAMNPMMLLALTGSLGGSDEEIPLTTRRPSLTRL